MLKKNLYFSVLDWEDFYGHVNYLQHHKINYNEIIALIENNNNENNTLIENNNNENNTLIENNNNENNTLIENNNNENNTLIENNNNENNTLIEINDTEDSIDEYFIENIFFEPNLTEKEILEKKKKDIYSKLLYIRSIPTLTEKVEQSIKNIIFSKEELLIYKKIILNCKLYLLINPTQLCLNYSIYFDIVEVEDIETIHYNNEIYVKDIDFIEFYYVDVYFEVLFNLRIINFSEYSLIEFSPSLRSLFKNLPELENFTLYCYVIFFYGRHYNLFKQLKLLNTYITLQINNYVDSILFSLFLNLIKMIPNNKLNVICFKKIKIKRWKFRRKKLKKLKFIKKLKKLYFKKKVKIKKIYHNYKLNKFNNKYQILTKFPLVNKIPLTSKIINNSFLDFFYKFYKKKQERIKSWNLHIFENINAKDNKIKEFKIYLRNYDKKPYWKLRTSRIIHWNFFFKKTLRQQRYKIFLNYFVKKYQKFHNLYFYFLSIFTKFHISWIHLKKINSFYKNNCLEFITNSIFILPKIIHYNIKWNFFKKRNWRLKKKIGKWSYLGYKRYICPWLQKRKNFPKIIKHLKPKNYFIKNITQYDPLTGYLLLFTKIPNYSLSFFDNFKINYLIKLHMFRYKAN